MRVLSLLLATVLTVSATETPAALRALAGEASKSIESLDRNVGAAAGWANGLSASAPEKARRSLLSRLVRSDRMVADAAWVSPQGRMVLLEPAAYKKYEQADISDQSSWQKMARLRRPVMSQAFRMVEGFYGIEIAHPVFQSGVWQGSISAVFRPAVWLERARRGPLEDLPFRFFAVQGDGLILDSSDPGFVGANLKAETSAAPAAMKALAGRILSEREGDGLFSKPSAGESGRTRVFWTTVGLHGAEFRLALTSDFAGAVPRGQVNAPVLAKALARLASRPEFASALSGDSFDAEDELLRFLHHESDIYSIQLLDAGGNVVTGQPIQTVPAGLRPGAVARPGSAALKAAMTGGRAASLEVPLLEGGTGRFFIQPLAGGKGSLLAIVRYE